MISSFIGFNENKLLQQNTQNLRRFAGVRNNYNYAKEDLQAEVPRAPKKGIPPVLLKGLPTPEKIYPFLLHLQFFALCVNGKRIPVSEVCDEYARDPEGVVYRTFGDRLVLVLEAAFPDNPTPYWRQAFYCSTGQNSSMPNTWLPFDGIVVRGSFSRYLGNWGVTKERTTPEQKKLQTELWFSKETFHKFERGGMRWPYDHSEAKDTDESDEMHKFDEVYATVYLPEGNFLWKRRRVYSRFGTLSYALASHAIGGLKFANPQGDAFTSELSDYTKKPDLLRSFKERFDVVSDEKPCFETMRTSLPLTKPYLINRYIEKYKALSIMNAFRPYNIFPPGLELLMIPHFELGYSMPAEGYWNILRDEIRKIWYQFQLGKVTIDEVKRKFENPQEYIKSYVLSKRENYIFPNEPEFTYGLSQKAMKDEKNYLGGRHRKTRRMKKYKTRRSSTKKHR